MPESSREHHRIDWPEDYDRTDPDEREPYPGNISVGHREAFGSIDEELGRWGAGLDRIEFAAPAYANDSRIPHESADPDDPGVAVYFRRHDDHADRGYAIACDRWNSLRDNARAISLYVRRKRLAERCGVATAQAEFQTAALPSGDEDDGAIAVGPAETSTAPHDVLDVAPDAPDDVVEAAARRKAANVHPDQPDGDEGRFKEIQSAKEAMLDGE